MARIGWRPRLFLGHGTDLAARVNISLGQFYHVYADNRKLSYDVSGGPQDNGTWIGPRKPASLPASLKMTIGGMIVAIVGFNVLSELEDPDIVFTQTPAGRCSGPICAPAINNPLPAGAQLQNGVGTAQMKYRFAWDALLVRSPFGKDTFYYGSNVIFQSSDEGFSREPISSDLTQADPAKWQPSGRANIYR